jgi:hypothetical protein
MQYPRSRTQVGSPDMRERGEGAEGRQARERNHPPFPHALASVQLTASILSGGAGRTGPTRSRRQGTGSRPLQASRGPLAPLAPQPPPSHVPGTSQTEIKTGFCRIRECLARYISRASAHLFPPRNLDVRNVRNVVGSRVVHRFHNLERGRPVRLLVKGRAHSA